MVTTTHAQSRLAPCNKQDYELLSTFLKEYFDPSASEQYLVMGGNKDKYALYLKKKGITYQPYGTLSVKDTTRSEEHTSELQSRQYLVCRLLLEKKTTPLSRMTSSD